MDFMAGLVLVW